MLGNETGTIKKGSVLIKNFQVLKNYLLMFGLN